MSHAHLTSQRWANVLLHTSTNDTSSQLLLLIKTVRHITVNVKQMWFCWHGHSQVDLYRPASHCHSHHLKPFRNCFRPSNIYTFTKTATTPKVTHSSAGVQTSHSLILFSAIQIDTSDKWSDELWHDAIL